MPEKRALDIGPDTCPECEFTWDYLLENGCMNTVNCVRNVDCATLTMRRHERNAAVEPPKSLVEIIEELWESPNHYAGLREALTTIAGRIDALERRAKEDVYPLECPNDCGRGYMAAQEFGCRRPSRGEGKACEWSKVWQK